MSVIIPGGIAELTDALAALDAMPPLDRARAVPDLIHQAMATLAAVRADAILQAEAAGMKRTEIAAELRITRQQITKLVGAKAPVAPAGDLVS